MNIKTTNIRILLMSFILLFAGFQPAAQALALGELELKSYLNQRLEVFIPLISPKEGDLSALRLSASRPDEEDLSLRVWRDLEAELIDNQGDEPYLRVTSKTPLREPSLSFVLDVRWPNGRIQRSYSLFLDLKP